MPVEIREVVIKAELSPRQIQTKSVKPPTITPEMISIIKSICENEIRQIRNELPHRSKLEKFER